MKQKVILSIALWLTALSAIAADGDVFTAQTIEGISVKYKVISEIEKTCQVGDSTAWEAAFDRNATGSITIPNEVNGYKVTVAGYFSFYNCNMSSVILPNSVTEIAPYAFCDSKIPSITLPNSVTSIGYAAFQSSNTQSITLPESLKHIDAEAFSHCSELTEIRIPKKVENISYGIFRGCEKLTSIVVDQENPIYDSREECNAIIETATNTMIYACPVSTIPTTVTTLGEALYEGREDIEELVIPEHITKIGFKCCQFMPNLKSLTLPAGLKSIGYGAFYRCENLMTITSHIEEPFEIDYDVFDCGTAKADIYKNAVLYVPAGCVEAYKNQKGWENFTRIREIGDTVDTSRPLRYTDEQGIDYLANFTDEVYEVVNIVNATGYYDINNTITYDMVIADSLFDYPVRAVRGNYGFWPSNHISTLTIPGTVEYIGYQSFRDLGNMYSLTLNEGLDSLGYEAFAYCAVLRSLRLPETLRHIGDGAFCGASLIPSLIVPSGVRHIGVRAFQWCTRMETLTIAEGVEHIGDYAFYGNIGLRHLSIPASVSTLGSQVFNWCTALSTVVSANQEPFDIDPMSFAEATYQQATLYVPYGTKSKYESTVGWQKFCNIVEADLSAVHSVRIDDKTPLQWHTLDGRSLLNKPRQKGVYVRDGKKVIVR